jgi:hypothetical protein
MAVLPDDRQSVLRRTLAALLIAAGAAAWPGPGASAGVVDAVLADVNGTVLALSDVALARALGLFGFSASEAPVERPEVERLIDARLVEREAARLEIEGTAAAAETAWQAAEARLGGPEALTAWLATAGVDPSWARQLVAADVRWRRFIEVRFRAFVFVPEADVGAALGTAAASPEERERMRRRLTDEATQRDLDRWLAEARARAAIHYAGAAAGRLPLPFAGPGPAR